jgi:hypothetical protein
MDHSARICGGLPSAADSGRSIFWTIRDTGVKRCVAGLHYRQVTSRQNSSFDAPNDEADFGIGGFCFEAGEGWCTGCMEKEQ